MKVDREYFDGQEYGGKKQYKLVSIDKGIKAYVYGYGEVWFEDGTDERIGFIDVAENRTNSNRYYHASCQYGWDGKAKTKKQFITKLCTKADYAVARALMIDEYKNRKAE